MSLVSLQFHLFTSPFPFFLLKDRSVKFIKLFSLFPNKSIELRISFRIMLNCIFKNSTAGLQENVSEISSSNSPNQSKIDVITIFPATKGAHTYVQFTCAVNHVWRHIWAINWGNCTVHAGFYSGLWPAQKFLLFFD